MGPTLHSTNANRTDPRDGAAPGILRINNNQFWRRLVSIGFRLGKNHDIARIRSTIPPKFLSDFDAGLKT